MAKDSSLQTAPKTAKDYITNHVPFLLGSLSVAEALRILHDPEKTFTSIEDIYVGEGKTLLGVIPLSDLYRLPEKTPLSSLISEKKLISVAPHVLPEAVAYTALKHECRSMPVVEQRHHTFLGVISAPTLLKILHKELREDILHLSGIHEAPKEEEDNIFTVPVYKSVLSRFPWLFIGLMGGMGTAKIVDQFEGILSEHIILASFIPLIAYIADAVGTQMEAYTIRDMAMFRDIKIGKYFLRQFSIVFIISLLLGFVLWGMSILFFHEHGSLGLVLFFSVIGASISSLFTGILIPFFFRKLKLDPANASGPIGTIIQDIFSIGVYFSIAQMLL